MSCGTKKLLYPSIFNRRARFSFDKIDQVYELNIFLYVLLMTGIYSVNVDYNQQKVTVWGICNKFDVLATMRSKRKEARFWNPEDNIALEESQPPSSSPSPPSNDYISKISISKPSLALTKVRSFSWKAMKKVFTRSYSF